MSKREHENIKDRESNANRTIYKSYVIDDGLNLPKEVVEVIEMRVTTAWRDAYKKVCEENRRHKGEWLDAEVVRIYETKSWVWRVLTGGLYIGKVVEIAAELRRNYGVTEIEAINILFGRNTNDYIQKYYRIKNRIPNAVNEQAICDEITYEYLEKQEAM